MLDSTAIPIDGQTAGVWDPQGGMGLINADAAVGTFARATVQMAAIASPRTTPVPSELITFNEPVTGFSLADLTLTRSGTAVPLNSGQGLTSAKNHRFHADEPHQSHHIRRKLHADA